MALRLLGTCREIDIRCDFVNILSLKFVRIKRVVECLCMVYCECRTPGHHAMKSEANGYCFFNNVAVATRFALTKLKLKRLTDTPSDYSYI